MELKANLLDHLHQIVRDRDPYLATAGHFFVKQYIRTTLEQWGDVETHSFSVSGHTHSNLILNLPASTENTQNASHVNPILIGAHYDAVPGTPGADDNATGVAVLLELARVFAISPLRFPLRLVAFDMEEYGMLGSAAYAQSLQEKGESLRLMLSLEMLGYCDSTPHSQRYPAGLQYLYPNQGDYIALIGNIATIPTLRHFKRHFLKVSMPCEWLPVPNKGLQIPQTRLSDHSPFWDLGYSALMVTDTAFMRNPHYHTPNDTIQTLDLDFLTGVCQGLINALRTL